MTAFESRVRQALQNPALQNALAFATRLARQNRASAMSWLESRDMRPEEMRERAHTIKREILNDLERWIDQLELRVRSNGGIVHRAPTAEVACETILKIASENRVRAVVKSKSMATEEIDLNERFESAGIEVLETDLGEYIVQLAREKPSHIIAPAIHKSRTDVARLFHNVFGTDDRLSPAQLTNVARQKLRQKFLEADLGVTGANFAIAETGTIVIVENEGNVRLTTTVPRIHIAVVGIEKVIRSWSDLQVLLPLLPPSATGQKITSYVSLINGPRRAGETDGPEQFHLVLIDNGRRRIRQDPVLREALACIRCGACLNACPVYGHIGGHAYGWVYPGPIGAVIGPPLRGIEAAGELPFASSLCGACLDACPVKIDIPKLLVHLRGSVNRTRPPYERWLFRLWSEVARRPRLYRRLAPLGRRVAPRVFAAVNVPKQSFMEQWKGFNNLN